MTYILAYIMPARYSMPKKYIHWKYKMTLKIVADENVPGEAIEALRRLGHDVIWTRIQAPGSPDESILALAQSESRIVITFDKDFGELAFCYSLEYITRNRFKLMAE
jgi:hypothetical protein